ncbi:MAG: ankyrin repeat domain-containing protein [Phycisphaerae bacterium]|nr:ankyrin repeat domain-containing protein [Phycisphaerae bacterium]
MDKRDFSIRLIFLAMLALAQSAAGIMSPWTPLKRASYSGDVEKVHELLAGGTNANGELDHGLTPLHWAATRGHKRVAEMLLANGADPNMDRTDAHCIVVGTPLHCAAYNGHVDVVRLLMANGADINYKSIFGDMIMRGTALHEAARGGHKEIVELLLIESADVNAKTYRDKTPLNFVRNGKTARVLMAYGADVRMQDENGKNPLDYAIRGSRPDVVRELLANGVKPSLHSAAMLGRLETLLDLIGGGADVNAKDMLGRTPLHLAVTGEIAEALIADGSDINCKGGNSITALMEAARAGRKNVVEVLLANGANMNVHNHWGSTAMHNAVRNGHKDIVEIFIAWDFDMRATGAELVFTAAGAGKRAVLQLLHENGAEIDTKAKNEYTPLHIAVFMGHTDVVEWLIDKGADINTSIEYGTTPLHSAVERGRYTMVELLVSKGAACNATNKGGLTPLDLAEQHDREEIAALLRAVCQ